MAKLDTVVVVDDEPPIRRLLRTSLAASGYRIVEALGGSIVARNRRDRSGAVLTIRMPVVPEITAAREPVMAHG